MLIAKHKCIMCKYMIWDWLIWIIITIRLKKLQMDYQIYLKGNITYDKKCSSNNYCTRFQQVTMNKKTSKFNKYIIGNIYRRPSDSVDELTLFIEEISTVLSKLNKLSQRSYICGDFNINLLNINNSDHCNNFFKGITTFYLKDSSIIVVTI